MAVEEGEGERRVISIVLYYNKAILCIYYTCGVRLEGSIGMGNNGEIVNALIENVSLSMEDHGALCYYLTLRMNGCGCGYGGHVIGKGYLGAKEFQGYEKGTEALMRIMDVVGVHRWEDITGKYVRVELPGWGGIVDRIGNIIEDKWFSQKEFFGGD